MVKVLTISGAAEAGKDTAAKIIKERLQESGKKVLIIHYADYLKFICKEYFEWDGQKDEKGRTLLQQIGTEEVRSRYPDFWAQVVVNFIRVLGHRYDFIIIPDTRFPNEIELVKDGFNTKSLHITRLDYENSLTPEQRQHRSETALDNFVFDGYIRSESGIDNLKKCVDDMLKSNWWFGLSLI